VSSARRLLLVDATPTFTTSSRPPEAREPQHSGCLRWAGGPGPGSQCGLRPGGGGHGSNGIDGLKLLRRMQEIRPKPSDSHREAEPCAGDRRHSEHAYSYFHKPLAPGPLADMVEQAVESSSWRDDIKMISRARIGSRWIVLQVEASSA